MKWIRKDLENFRPYHADVPEHKIKLDANESPFALPEAIRSEFIKWFENEEDLNIYPDSDCNALREAIAQFWSVDKENILCGVGSDQIIDYITKVFLEPGDVVVAPKPSFSMYALTSVLNHGKIIEIELKNSAIYNIYDIIESVNKHKAKLLFLCTPNNPTGNSLTENEIIQIVSSLDCPVLVDEAYADFSGQTMIPYINKYKNMIVLRTFSKAYGLAGARVGYAVASSEMIEAIGIVKAPYNLSTISQTLAILALKHSDEYKKRIETLNRNKDSLYKELKTIPGVEVFPSDANFLFIKTDRNISKAFSDNGILIRTFKRGENEVIRLSVGTKEQNQAVFGLLKNIFLGGE